MSALKGPEVTKSIFGGIFDVDGAGHFPGLELINFIVCGANGVLPGPEVPQVALRRVSHDFARRLVADFLPPDIRAKVFLDQHSETAVTHLLRCLELEVSNTLKAKSWERTHFFPYTRSLVHWDARSARGGNPHRDVQLERRYYRGGGAYAYHVLRYDKNIRRLDEIRSGFNELYPLDNSSPLSKLADALLKHGNADASPVVDTIEPQSNLFHDGWEELYREGMLNILSHRLSPHVRRIRAVMNWTGIWLVLLEGARAANFCERSAPGIVVDSGGTHPQLRRASQKCLKEHLTNIHDATSAYKAKVNGEISDQQLNKIKAFFSNTAAACGLLNSTKGRRHFTLKLPAIEALVLACTTPNREVPFESFVSDWLGGQCGLIIGRESATRAGLLASFDATIFEENERQFAEQMRGTGMLRVYSDATRIVSPEVMQ